VSARVLQRRVFDEADQRAFAALSGDTNAIHLDRAAARREFYGRRILHGLHGAMAAVEALLAERARAGGGAVRLARLQGRFHAPVFLGEDVELAVARDEGHGATLEVRAGGQRVYELQVAWLEERAADEPVAPPSPAGPARDTELAELAGRHGSLALWLDPAALRARFPALAGAGSARAAAAGLAVTRLVGMECPGAQSLLSAFDLHFDGPPGDELRWTVTAADARFSLVRMQVEGGGLRGTVEAFHRPRPVAQPGWPTVAAAVRPGEFAALRPLVVGGSRGAGEVAALALAAGGAEPVITWHRLEAEAARVRDAIAAAGGRCTAIPWDGADPRAGEAALAGTGVVPTHLLYMATPRIATRKLAGWDPATFARLARVHADGLHATVQAVRRRGRGRLGLLVPSTVAVEAPARGLAEYGAAKAAAEVVARALAAADRELRVHCPRWPRLRTDQAQALAPAPADEPLPHVLAALRALAGTAA
jgi:acyl dehydratase/NAD(P)-dependent dehydrogenase (short-subunit alcohol dehydrogenase family)